MADREQPAAAERQQYEQQGQGQDQEGRQPDQERPPLTYENKDYIHVHDFQVREYQNSQTGQSFWDVKLMKGTFIEHEGQRLDVGHYHFRTNQEPLVIHGEPGTPQCMRSIHYPDGWDLTLTQVKNVAIEGHDPIFEVTDRIEGVTPQGDLRGRRRARLRLPRPAQEVPGAGAGAGPAARSARQGRGREGHGEASRPRGRARAVARFRAAPHASTRIESWQRRKDPPAASLCGSAGGSSALGPALCRKAGSEEL